MTLKLAKPTGAAIKIAKPTGAKLSITPSNLLVDDADALAYLTAVETTDGQALESGVRLAVNAFVKGCKADGIWPALKASCILAGARTRLGALTPLVGTAPTSFNFVDADYNRKTGLVGDGSTKYLNSNRNNNADPQNSKHCVVQVSAIGSIAQSYMGIPSTSGSTHLSTSSSGVLFIDARINAAAGTPAIGSNVIGFIGLCRTSFTNVSFRSNNVTANVTNNSSAPSSGNLLVFDGINKSSARIAFYSVGTSLDLALLDARVTTLINAIGAAIP